MSIAREAHSAAALVSWEMRLFLILLTTSVAWADTTPPGPKAPPPRSLPHVQMAGWLKHCIGEWNDAAPNLAFAFHGASPQLSFAEPIVVAIKLESPDGMSLRFALKERERPIQLTHPGRHLPGRFPRHLPVILSGGGDNDRNANSTEQGYRYEAGFEIESRGQSFSSAQFNALLRAADHLMSQCLDAAETNAGLPGCGGPCPRGMEDPEKNGCRNFCFY